MFKKKKFGQNFLKDKLTLKKIVEIGNINSESEVIEIGPGDGSLTNEILQKKPKSLFAVEIDKDLKEILNEIKKKNHNFDFTIADAVNFNEEKIFKNNCIIFSNLPYNISTTLLLKWIFLKKWPPFFSRLILMFQKEVADRICAKSGEKNFGRLSLVTRARLETKFHFNVSKDLFNPCPKVDSSVISFAVNSETNFNNNELMILSNITNIIFNKKRKMIGKTLEKLLTLEERKIINYDNIKTKRPEDLDFKFYQSLVSLLSNRTKIN